ncbi:MAG: hypothetical protein KF708_18245 [Pirellulales bacterium]|nr:hypothetical protein [Pirellulales bacterium]
MNEIRLDLNVIVYWEDEWWIAHCLELDLPAEGSSPEEAMESLMGLIMLQVTTALAEGNIESVYAPAPAELWRMFSIARDMNISLTPSQPIHRVNARELTLA